ncbi:MAG: SRPBCC domain-containing protein [Candidatus Lambdaproteobacteria bacterium]|nr:SRPBCC domain-containing protein [Candidatus Lambdaproteobacteria bacterium]
MSELIHQEVTFKTKAKRVYDALMNSKEHAAFTGGPAEISKEAGGPFTCHGGHILGRNVELVPNKRIVQAWRAANWDEGVYSIVRFELVEKNGQTQVVMDHTGVPDAGRNDVAAGWKSHYWEPLAKYLA